MKHATNTTTAPAPVVTIGKGCGWNDNGQPRREWNVLIGEEVVGEIVAEYGDNGIGFAHDWFLQEYVVDLLDQRGGKDFSAKEFGSARKALAAAKAYAKGNAKPDPSIAQAKAERAQTAKTAKLAELGAKVLEVLKYRGEAATAPYRMRARGFTHGDYSDLVEAARKLGLDF